MFYYTSILALNLNLLSEFIYLLSIYHVPSIGLDLGIEE